MRTLFLGLYLSLALAAPAAAADVHGSVTDRSGGVLPNTTVRLSNVATGQQITAATDAAGHFQFPNLKPGIYRVATSLVGFSDASRNVVVTNDSESLAVDFELEVGSIKADVTVSAARGERDTEITPIRADTVSADAVREMAPVSTGDALSGLPGVTLVGSGPFQVRPRLRGLDSTRVLVLVDGERLNNARTATDRAGVEVGLVDVSAIDSVEVLGGAGSVLYGTDALSGTINIITNRAHFSDTRRVTAGFGGFYSSNENGRRANVSLGMSDKRWAVSFKGGAEEFDNYKAGKKFQESSQQFLDSGQIHQVDTIDDFFPPFAFKKFPDPFNAPYTRTDSLVPNSSMSGTSANLSGLAMITPSQTLEMKYQHRRAEDVGFPDFAEPYFFQGISVPWSQLDRFSASYTVTNVTSSMTRLTITPYYQRQDRQLRNLVPVQFPQPSPGFFPIAVNRLDIVSDTRQQVWTPGLDVQATFLTHPNNVLTAGLTIYQDRSKDERTSTTRQSQIGQVALGQFGPAATVFPSPIFASETVSHPTRVPNATFRDTGAFVLDELDATSAIRLSAGLRVDGYRVKTDATPGYDVASLVAGAVPPIDPSTLADVNGQLITRSAVTGEAGIVVWSSRPVNLFSHYVHSYRHPNLEELLFSGPATAGNIVPNVKVEPETGHNFDAGVRVHTTHFNGSVSYFNNTYSNFISTEIVAAITSQSGTSSLSQAINLAKVRIQGVEGEGSAPIIAGRLTVLPFGTISYNRGEVLEGTSPLSGVSLAGEPQDNITPWKVTFGVRASDRNEHWWATYNVRTETDVKRVSPLLSDSEFLIPQDLFGLAGFSIHRVAVGYDWRKGDEHLGLVLSVDNLTDTFYREQFQFAPARGRSVSLLFNVGGGR